MRYLIILAMLFIFSCKSSKEYTESNARQDLNLGTNEMISCVSNESNSFKLCASGEQNKAGELVSFLVYDINKQQVVFKKSLESGYTKWINDFEIEYFSVPGTVKDTQSKDDFVWVYNTQTGKSSRKTDNTQLTR